MQRVQLLHIITRLPIGGAERLLLVILRNLDPVQFESVVCCIQDRGKLADEVKALGIPVIALNLLKRGGHDRHVVPALRKHHIDLAHIHLYHANLYGRLGARKEGIPAIANIYNIHKKRKWHRHLINRWLAAKSFIVTVGSKDVEKDLLTVDRLPNNKMLLLPNSIYLSRVETDLDATKAKQHFGFASDNIVISAVGRMKERKELVFLLHVLAKLRQRLDGEQGKSLPVGNGRLLPALKKTAKRLNIAANCHFPSGISRLTEVYRAIDLFTMPSLWEGLSLTMLEATVGGLPVVATEVKDVRNILDDNQSSLLVSAYNVDILAAALAKLLDNPYHTPELAAKGRTRAHANYNIAATLHRPMAEMYYGPSPNTLLAPLEHPILRTMGHPRTGKVFTPNDYPMTEISADTALIRGHEALA